MLPLAQLRGLGDHRVDQLGLLADRDQHRRGHASLARAAGERRDDVRRGHWDVAVGRGDQVVLRAAEREHLLAGGARAVVHELGNPARADERERRDARVVAERADDVGLALHHLESAGGHARLEEQLGGALHRERDLFARLEDHAVTSDQRDRDGPERHLIRRGARVASRNSRRARAHARAG